jgi:hypothetical protein
MKYAFLIAASVAAAAVVSLSASVASTTYVRQDAARQNASDVSGVYLCQGTLPDGRQYDGTVVIVRHQNTYQLLWTLTEQEQYLGIGILHDKTLAVSVFGNMGGVVSYQVDRQSNAVRLKGQWTVVEADGRVFGETLTRLADAPLEVPLFKLEPAPAPQWRRRPASSWLPI